MNLMKTVGGLLLLLCAGAVSARAAVYGDVTISITGPGQIKVETEFSAPLRSWSFRNVYAGALGIAERVDEFRAFAGSGQAAHVRKSAVGEFRSELEANRISYIVKLSERRAEHFPYVSWLAGDRGILMFADLVPIDIEGLSCKLILPNGWNAESAITPDANGRYNVREPQKAVFIIGSLLRKRSGGVDGMSLETVVSGIPSLKQDDVWKMAAQVMRKHFALTGFRLPGKSVIMIAPLPARVGQTMWKAEARGSTVVLLVNEAAGREMSKAQLGVIFTHELLHLWVPNALKLAGDYDWFFEGFTMYVALRTALELKIIKFRGFLDTLGNAYKYYLDHPDDVSLVRASETRWTAGFSHVYIKGMLVAFVYDLMLRSEWGGTTTLADRYRDLFSGAVSDGGDGNEVIIGVLGVSPATSDFTKSYIENSRQIKLEQLLAVYGLEVHFSAKESQIKVNSKLDEDQKQLLRSLGY